MADVTMCGNKALVPIHRLVTQNDGVFKLFAVPYFIGAVAHFQHFIAFYGWFSSLLGVGDGV